MAQNRQFDGRMGLEEDRVKPGELLGKYQALRALGHGLWLAERTSDFDQRVTVMLVESGESATHSRDFSERRRQLAGLHHPAIPRLLDWGVTAGHTPYLLFEFVEARPALAWADAQNAALPQRIALAVKFVEALALAHRSLLAHGSLDMESFRVTEEGHPRLAEFQGAISVADPVAADLQAVGDFAVSLLSQNGRMKLPRDLQLIVGKATSPLRASRYNSADELAADLQAFVDRRPVSVRKPTPLYNAALFACRRPELFYPGIALVICVLLATGLSLARDAAAKRSRNQAQNRLHQLQRLTYSLESDLYAPVSVLPNSASARETLIHWTAESLDRLTAEAGDDTELRSQIAFSYQRLAEVERSNGDAAAARHAEQQAVAVQRQPQ